MTEGDGTRGSLSSQKRVAELALAVITMRVQTPAGKWLDETFGDEYYNIWREAKAIDGEDAEEGMFLSVVNMASLLVEYVTAAAQGSTAEDWLRALRADYVDTMAEGGESDA